MPDYGPFLLDAEARHDLPAGLLGALVQQESGGNPYATRYEPDFAARYIGQKPLDQLPGRRAPGATEATERVARATSWGLGQVMGEVARELGFAGPFLSQLCDPEIGLHYAGLKLRKCLDAADGDVTRALQRYNGGATSTYAAAVLARWRP